MIAKFDGISGQNLATLLTFIHGDENRTTISRREEEQLMIVRIKAVNSDNQQSGGTCYGLTLEILEWLPKREGLGQNRVDPKYLLKVYEILGEDQLTKSVSKEGNGTTAEKWPPILPGIAVKTTKPNMALRKEWSEKGWASKKWGMKGYVITYRDGCGLYYSVRHEDGTEGCYDPSELEVIEP
ncbi:MAG: hypothetical protein AAB809_01855 [Patescibacteria group bacterium]